MKPIRIEPVEGELLKIIEIDGSISEHEFLEVWIPEKVEEVDLTTC